MPQWHFYSEMIYQDRKTELDREIAITEYLASFWNPEAVKKAREMRSSSEMHNFKNDLDFEESLLSGEYKENTLLDAIQKIRNIKDKEPGGRNVRKKEVPKSKLPTDLSSIHSTLEKFK